MPNIGPAILGIFLLIITHAILVLSETALVKARKSRLLDWAKEGSEKAKIALDLHGAPNQFLSTARMGITLVGILTGVVGAGTIADRLAWYFSVAPALEPYGQALGLGIVVVGIAFFLLTLGELIPRRLALINPEGIAVAAAVPMRALTKVCAPVVRLLTLSTDALSWLLGRGPHQEPAVTEEEIRSLVQQGTEAGVFEESEQDLVEAVFRLDDRSARSLMTPRTQIVWFDLQDSPEQIRRKIAESGHSCFPVCKETLDNVVGVAQAKDLLVGALAGHAIDLKVSVQQPAFVPRTMSALQVLEMVKGSGSHLALVVDEYGGIEGLLTHHDILEAIAGGIPFGRDPGEPKAVQRHDGSWLLDGMLSVDEFKEILHRESLPGEKRDAYQTLGGFIFTQMGRVPVVADYFEWKGLRFEIVDMDGKRIDKVLVTPVEASVSVPRTDAEKNGNSV
jgi:magnesium and cobalt exporter, CNNM family